MIGERDVINTTDVKSVNSEGDELDVLAHVLRIEGLSDRFEVAHRLTNCHAELVRVYQPREFDACL
jgi:hypothetical protein